MCGILGYVGKARGAFWIPRALRHMRVFGEDGVGYAFWSDDGLKVVRQDCRVVPRFASPAVMAHTRWATHGAATIENAHPHASCGDEIVVVHNGIYEPPPGTLRTGVHDYRSRTDSEKIAHLLEERYDGDLSAAVRNARTLLKGCGAFIAMHKAEPGAIIAHVDGGTLYIAKSRFGTYLASTTWVLPPHAARCDLIGSGTTLRLAHDEVFHYGGSLVTTELTGVLPSRRTKGFLTEVRDQPTTIALAMKNRAPEPFVSKKDDAVIGQLANARRILFTGAGSSLHACEAGARAFLRDAGIPSIALCASELAPDDIIQGDIVVAVSQSGHTRDAVLASETAIGQGAPVIAVTTDMNSPLALRATAVGAVPIRRERATVASGSFLATTAVLHAYALHTALRLGRAEKQGELEKLASLPDAIAQTLSMETIWQREGACAAQAEKCIVLGHGATLPIAREITLKLRELADALTIALPAGELKHGPLRLVDSNTHVLAVLDSEASGRSAGWLEIARSRGATVLAVTGSDAPVSTSGVVSLPLMPLRLQPFALTVAGQLIAYSAARRRGSSIDHPRHLAKIVNSC